MAERKLSVVITGDAKGARKAFGDVGSSAGGMQSKLQSVGAGVGKVFKAAAVGAGVLAVGVGAFLKGGVDSLIELEKLGAQTEAVIKSTGGAAGVSAEQVSAYADSIEKATGVEAEGIIQGQNMLLTFTNLKNGVGEGNDIFNQATDIMTDMSVAMGTDASKTAVQLGKALNDPIRGISALSKAGVTFTDQQKAQIKAMVEAGDVAGAQKIILAELNKEFGGSAEAFGDTTAGKVQKLKNLFGDFQEELASRLLPVITKVADWLADKIPKASALIQAKLVELAPTFDKIAGYAGDVAGALGRFAERMRPVVEAIGSFIAKNPAPFLGALATVIGGALVTATVAWGVSLFAALSPIYLVVAAVALVAGGLIYAYQHFEGFRNVVDSVASWLTGVLWPALQTLGGYLLDALPVAAGLARDALGWIATKAAELYFWFEANVLPTMQTVASWLSTNVPVAAGLARDALGWIVSKATELYNWFSINVLPVLRSVASFVSTTLVAALTAGRNWIGFVIDKATEFYAWFNDNVLPVIQKVADYLTQKLGPGLSVARDVIGEVITKARELVAWFLVNLGPQLEATANFLKGAFKVAFDIATGTIDTMWGAVQTLWSWLDKVLDVAGKVAGAVGNIPGVGAVGNVLGAIGVPGFAAGGRPPVGRLSVVGERGPELFVPDRPGTIVPAASTRSMLGGRGGGDTYVTIQMNGPVLDGRELGRLAAEGLNEYGASQNAPIIATGLVGGPYR